MAWTRVIAVPWDRRRVIRATHLWDLGARLRGGDTNRGSGLPGSPGSPGPFGRSWVTDPDSHSSRDRLPVSASCSLLLTAQGRILPSMTLIESDYNMDFCCTTT